MDNAYKNILVENQLLHERVPWRSGNVPIEIGKTSLLSGIKQDCIVLNNLKIITLKPSFMIVVPDITDLDSPGGGSMGTIILNIESQQMEFKSIEKGTCRAVTYFFGRPKPGRTFDFLLRAFEQGFSISDCKGLDTFPPDARVEFTISEKAKHTEKPTKRGTRKDRNLKIPCRIRRVK